MTDHIDDGRRRTLLTAGGVATIFATVGCIGDGDDGPTAGDDTADTMEDVDDSPGGEPDAGDAVEDSDDDGAVTDTNADGASDTGDETDDDTDEVEPVSHTLEEVLSGLAHPWGMAFIPDDSRMLVTERGGRLNLIDRTDGTREVVEGTPNVAAVGQGGLLDVTVHPDFPDASWVYLTYAASNEAGESATHLGRGRLDGDTPQLDGFEVIHVAEPFVTSNGHFGSRVVFGEDGLVYITSGDRQFKDFGPEHVAQDPSNELGAILRLEPDGSIPADNPFVDDPGAADAIFSYGHRNPQGLTVHPETGELWSTEHGEQDGDEINVVERGGNHGWPIATYACTYGSGAPIGDYPDERDDLVAPVHFWACGSGGFPPAGATFYDSDTFPQWRGDLFVGNLVGHYLGRFCVDGRDVEELDPLLAGRGWRIRDVAVAPDTGHLYVVVDAEHAPLVRLVPE